MNGLTDHLFAMPSFLGGFGRVLDFSGELDENNFAETPEESDANAIYSDFCAVGEDMWAAIHQFERELERGTR
jgi:hypothetical protein